jgi:hypothetical protein
MNQIAISPVVHIGMHKTATTYLQTSVFSNKAVFQRPWGGGSALAVEHFVLQHPERFSAQEARKAVTDALIPDSPLIPVISHEELSGNPMNGQYDMDRVATRIHATLPEARILIGIREQNSAILSNYSQYIRQGGTKPLMDLLTTARPGPGYRPTMRLDHFEYDLIIQHYARLFGSERVLVLPIEQLRQHPALYCERLKTFLSTTQDFQLPETVVNARRTAFSRGLERQLNKVVASPKIRAEAYSDNPFAFRLKNRVLRGVDTALGRFATSSSGQLKDQISSFVGDTFAASNARTANLIGQDLAALGYKTG